ncbi:MAG: bifunctional 2-C-methyl-D-erythritol 4-phosphate cytidylyltransferase/2-C-methyl-D-erythritol 2,4-cyclodiphosphate synthase [Alphaproteobacteria bacterium]|nr:bifunctional 2-C-methyl-D-erythritol 4-phosphate cytidylyltransferase/2-C-methyl-D-erythritol 2,4-cyclodiphosphate synthase [Alphaproteobacteria bacterium]
MPKQYRLLGGEPVLRRACRAFLGHPAIGGVRVVIHPDDRVLYEAAVEGLGLPEPILGGESRQESVLNALAELSEDPPRAVLVHDAVRPLVGAALIDRVVAGLETHAAVLPALPVADTLKRAAPGTRQVESTLDRTDLHAAQTPQGFAFAPLYDAHLKARAEGRAVTDDAALAEAAGLATLLVPGERAALKLTVEEDFAMAEALIARTPARTAIGQGFDVHRFGPGDSVMLCGISVPHTHGLVGHSDADVALHALTDAILGALGAGDIGTHFPPSDPRWKGAASARFVAHAMGLLAARGGTLAHADLTLICERPKIGPHAAAMKASLGALLGLPPERIGLKATTTEGLGFTGRSEGIAAQAVVTLSLPADPLPDR